MSDFSDLIEKLADHPEAMARLVAVETATSQFMAECDATKTLDKDEAVVAIANAQIRLLVALGEERETIARLTDEMINRRSPTKLGVGYDRALATFIAYKQGARLSSTASQIPPMQAARRVASILMEYPHDFAELPLEAAARFHTYLERNDIGASDETMRRSIRRFRKSLKGMKVVRFDRNKLEFEVLDAEQAYFPGPPMRPGRPRRT